MLAEAAREDVERALELAEGLNDKRTTADIYFQVSIIADREGHWVLARSYAERAKAAYEELSDLGQPRPAAQQPRRDQLPPRSSGGSRRLLEGCGPHRSRGRRRRRGRTRGQRNRAGTSAHRRPHPRGRASALCARAAEGRVDETAEIGNAQLVLGRALLEKDRLDEAETAFKAGEQAYDQLSSGSHRASAWVAQGDLAARRGDDRTAARLYRQAADALQDVRF